MLDAREVQPDGAIVDRMACGAPCSSTQAAVMDRGASSCAAMGMASATVTERGQTARLSRGSRARACGVGKRREGKGNTQLKQRRSYAARACGVMVESAK